MTFDKLPINIFDCILLVVLTLGIVRGRRHGMSEELLNVLKWLTILVACAMLYEPAGRLLASWSPFSALTCFVTVYLVVALSILGVFALSKHLLGGKLLGSDLFGRGEYYLGMGSGMVRFACILLAVLALLNSRYFSPEEVRAMERFQNENYGSNFFPTLHTAQSVVFERSLTGPWIREHLGFLLIKPTPPERKEIRQKEANLPY
jgi:uncharacterized membrane protein required for colicin V production